jgi:hypothetical protein
MKPSASDVPPRLLDLIERAAREQCELLQVELAPSIVPSDEEISRLTADLIGAD